MRHHRSGHGHQAMSGGGGGGGHHGHHGHGGGGRRGGWGGGPGWGYPWYASEPDVFLIQNVSDPDQVARAMAYIMSLPKAQRAAAYTKIFGSAPAPGALGGTKVWRGMGDVDAGTVVKYAAVAVGGLLLYNLIKKR